MNSNRQRTILLTGATGFIGAAVVKRLLQAGDLPVVLIRPSSDLTRLQKLKGYETIAYNTLTSQDLGHRVRSYAPQAFVHLAWRGTNSKEHNQPYQITDNLPQTIASVKLANLAGCRQWIGVGSQTEYGCPNRQVSEEDPPHPISAYGRAKLASCWAALGLSEAYQICGTWVRLFGVYGADDEPYRLFPYVVRELASDRVPKVTECRQLWDYLYIDDVASAIVSLIDAEAGGIFNVGSGEAVALKTAIEYIRELTNPKICPEYGAIAYGSRQVMHLQADVAKLKRVAQWYPKIGLEDGLQRTVEHFRSRLPQ